MKLNIRVGRNGKTPTYKTKGAVGADIYSAEDAIISVGSIKLIHTDIYMEVPEGYEIQLRPRSGLAVKESITIINSPGTVDNDYRGEIMIGLINLSAYSYKIFKGDRIAQMILAPVEKAEFNEMIELSATERGNDGFGSTGTN